MTQLAIFIDWYTPAYKAGGPISSCVNLVKVLENKLSIHIITSNEDLHHEVMDVAVNKWIDYGPSTSIIYLDKKHRTLKTIYQIIKEKKIDTVFCNSMFSIPFSFYPILGSIKLGVKKIILSPRGMLKESALSHKALKKQIFLKLLKTIGLPKKLIFHGNSTEELNQIKSVFGSGIEVIVIPNVPKIPETGMHRIEKKDKIKFLFLGRIHSIKGLNKAVEFLLYFCDTVELSVIGTIEQAEYWKELTDFAKEKGLLIKYFGSMKPEKVFENIKKHHFLILPTHGENFGHAIFESFAVGRPVLISDQTPWRDLEEKKIGFDLPLDDTEGWISALNQIIHMEQKEYDQWCQNALDYAHEFVETSNLKERYLQLFS